MMRYRLRARLEGERGFTLIELIVVMILIAILAAIALAVFLNQADKGKDSSAKSDVTNVVRMVQECNAGRNDKEDFRDCDSPSKLGGTGLPISSMPASEIASGDCSDPAPADSVGAPSTVRILEAGQDCFVVLGLSGSGNRFWVVRHNSGEVSRDCTTHNVHGCPSNGAWAG